MVKREREEEDFEDVEDDDDVVIVKGPATIIDKFFGGDGIEDSDEGEDGDDGDDGDDSEEARFQRFKEWEDSQGGGQPTPIKRQRRKRAQRVRDTGTEGGRRRGYFDS